MIENFYISNSEYTIVPRDKFDFRTIKKGTKRITTYNKRYNIVKKFCHLYWIV